MCAIGANGGMRRPCAATREMPAIIAPEITSSRRLSIISSAQATIAGRTTTCRRSPVRGFSPYWRSAFSNSSVPTANVGLRLTAGEQLKPRGRESCSAMTSAASSTLSSSTSRTRSARAAFCRTFIFFGAKASAVQPWRCQSSMQSRIVPSSARPFLSRLLGRFVGRTACRWIARGIAFFEFEGARPHATPGDGIGHFVALDRPAEHHLQA